MEIVPFASDPSHEFTCQLGDGSYAFAARYNERSESWTCDITRESDGEVLLAGVPMLLGQDVLAPYALGIGGLCGTDLANTDADAGAGDEDLGERVIWTWLSPEDLQLLREAIAAARLASIIPPGAVPGSTGASGVVPGPVYPPDGPPIGGGDEEPPDPIPESGPLSVGDVVPLVSATPDSDTSGDEVLLPWNEWVVDCDNLDSTMRFAFTCYASSEAGTGTIRAYLGGTPGTIDGVMIGSVTATSPTETAKRIIATGIANPGGLVPFKLTIQSSAADVEITVRAKLGSFV